MKMKMNMKMYMEIDIDSYLDTDTDTDTPRTGLWTWTQQTLGMHLEFSVMLSSQLGNWLVEPISSLCASIAHHNSSSIRRHTVQRNLVQIQQPTVNNLTIIWDNTTELNFLINIIIIMSL
jgi:hypothetical protein